MVHEDRLLAVLALNRNSAGQFAPEIFGLMEPIAMRSAQAIQNSQRIDWIEEESLERPRGGAWVKGLAGAGSAYPFTLTLQ